MFRRLVFEDSAALFTLAAFITAVSIYLTIGWRALRMKRPQLARFENLPFDVATPAAAGRALSSAEPVALTNTERRARRRRPTTSA